MPTEEPQDIDEVPERELDRSVGEHPEGHAEEIELHTPPKQVRRRPVAIDPQTEALLREHLGSTGAPHPRRSGASCRGRRA
jgi:hypothetical protein